MKAGSIAVAFVVVVAGALAGHAPRAQQVGSTRIDLQRHDLSIDGREVVKVIVELDVGSRKGAELATYIVEKGKPLLTVVGDAAPR